MEEDSAVVQHSDTVALCLTVVMRRAYSVQWGEESLFFSQRQHLFELPTSM